MLTIHDSLFWILLGSHLAHVAGPFFRCRPPHHLPRRNRRLAAHRTATFSRVHYWWCFDHHRILPSQLEFIPGDERGAEEEVHRG